MTAACTHLARTRGAATWALALLLAVGESHAQEPLRVAVSQALSPPFVISRDNQPLAGFDIELTRLIATQVGRRAEWLILPRPRVEAALAAGEADLACNAELPRREGVLPGPVLLDIQDLLLGHATSPATDAPEQLPAATLVGTLLGQTYVALDPLFADGRLRRDEALSDEKLLRKLAVNRHPYGVSSQPVVSWYTSKEPLEGLGAWRLQLGGRAYRCVVSARARVDPQQLLAAIGQVQASSRVAQLIADVLTPAVAVVVSTRSPLKDVNRQTLVELFMGQRATLRDGSAAEPVMSAGTTREQFFNSVLRLAPAEYRSAWAAQQFGGRRRAPLELIGPDAVKAHLQRNNAAIGYLPLNLVDASMRIVFLP